MDGPGVLEFDALLSVVLARRKRLPFRLGLVAAIAVLSAGMTGWEPALLWAAVYTAHQTFENWCGPGRLATPRLSCWQSAYAVTLFFTGNVIFGSLGVVQAIVGGPWGLALACLIWSGAFVQVAVGNAGSRKIVLACATPAAAYFLSIPFLVTHNGGSLGDGIIVLFGAFLNALGILELWSASEKRFEAERKQRLATYVAHRDPETGLPNRLAFEEAVAAEPANDATLVVAVLGIDRFADLRGAIGYALAARLIGKVNARLGDVHSGIVARLSASTLGVLFHAKDAAEARVYAARLQSTMANCVVVDGIDMDVSLTAGLALHSAQETTGVLLERAGIALGVARKARTGVTIFEASDGANPAGNLSLMSDMLRSIANGEITNHYQPKYDLHSGQLVGVEALVRWHHAERGKVAPDEFIPLAEETGRIRELTLDVLARAVRDQAWMAARGYPLAVAVNLSGRLLDDPEIIRTIIDIARAAVAKISMEVTETAIMANPDIALSLLRSIRTAGIGVSIDDYGSGLSSLAYLKNIPAEELKIDKSFVTNLHRDRQDCLLVRSTIALAHSFGLRVVAEGVETARTLEILGQMNCDLVQGYYMARPMPIEQLAELMASGSSLGVYSRALPVSAGSAGSVQAVGTPVSSGAVA